MSYSDKKFIVIGAGELQIPLIKAAKNLGLTVITTDKNAQAPGFELSDDFIIADTMNAQESLNNIQKYVALKGEIHGVATAGTDASYTVATIAHYFNLPGHHPNAALNASDKSLMRNAFEKAGVSIPLYKTVTNLEEALSFFEELNHLCVVKPTRNMGARGISLVRSVEELTRAIELAQENNREFPEILIEEYIDAHELSIDALINNGIITITGIADRIIEYPPYFVETGHILPSSLNNEWLERAIFSFRDGIKALGLSHGAAKADIKISKEKTWVIEIAARLSGGFMSSHTFPLATGIPLHEYMVKTALGENIPKLTPNRNFTSIERAIILPPGKVTSISIPDNILEQEYISHFSIKAQVDDIIVSPKNNLDKHGNIIATAPTRELALRAINKSLATLRIAVEDTRDYATIIQNSERFAKKILKTVCNVCRACDGIWCRGQIPGIGGLGTGEAFIQAYSRFQQIKLIPNYINEIKTVDTSITMFDRQFSMPIFIAPISGGSDNYNNAITELNLQRTLIKGAKHAGTMAFTPDSAYPELFPKIAQAILENFGHSVVICKPRKYLDHIKLRYQLAVESGILGIGSDIDGIGLKTFANTGQETTPKTVPELKELSQTYKLPFVIKGVLSVSDSLKAIEAGATHIVVSSHGGRISDSSPLPIDMLPHIKKVIANKAVILVDGAIRSGADIAKALILGADAVLIGRPASIHAIGGGYEAVTVYLNTIKDQLQNQMLLLGVSSIKELKERKDLIFDPQNIQQLL